jgi:hypothetical protein
VAWQGGEPTMTGLDFFRRCPRQLHDAYRVDKGGKGSFYRAMQGLAALQRHDVEWNALATVHAANQDRGRDVLHPHPTRDGSHVPAAAGRPGAVRAGAPVRRRGLQGAAATTHAPADPDASGNAATSSHPPMTEAMTGPAPC